MMNDISLAPQAPQTIGRNKWDLDSPEFEQRLLEISQEFAQSAAQHDRDGSFPHDNFKRLHEDGLLALTVPRHLGGYGANLAQTRKVIAAVAKGEPSTALVLTMQYLQHTRLQHNQHWPEHFRLQVANDAVQHGALINALRVEPDLGTPARGGLPNTIATRVEGGWLLNGHKIYSTGIAGLSWLAVWARTEDSDACDGTARETFAGREPWVGTWLVPHDSTGIEVLETWDHLGMRATGSHDVIFHDVFVPDDHAVDVHPASADRRSELDQQGTMWLSVLLGSIYDGVAQAARNSFVAWLHSRKPANLNVSGGGASLATLPRFQGIVGRIDSLLLNNQILLDSAATGQVAYGSAGQIKYLVTSNAIQAVEAAIAAAGNPGLDRRNDLERHYRDVLCSRIHTPQNDVILLDAGRRAVNVTQTTDNQASVNQTSTNKAASV